MSRFWGPTLLVFLLTCFLPAGPHPWAAPAGLQVRVDRVTFSSALRTWVRVFVSVTEPSGLAVKDLKADNFRISENDQPFSGRIGVKTFVATDRELGYILLLDHREDMAASLTIARQGAAAFISDMGFRYTGAALSYADQPFVIADPIKHPGRLGEAVLALEPVAGTPRLSDALLLGVQTLESLSGLDRRVMVLLTEGLNRGSLFSLDAAEARVLESGAVLFVVGYGLEERPIMKTLADLARQTGGGYFFADSLEGISPCLLAAADRLKNQYVLTYRPVQIKPDGRKHSLEVEVNWQGRKGRGQLEVISPDQASSRLGPLVAGLGVVVLSFLIVAARRFRWGRNRA